MLNLKREICKQLQPTRLAARKLCLRLKVSKGSVIRLNHEGNADQVVPPLLQTQHKTYELAVCRGIVLLSRGESLAEELTGVPLPCLIV